MCNLLPIGSEVERGHHHCLGSTRILCRRFDWRLSRGAQTFRPVLQLTGSGPSELLPTNSEPGRCTTEPRATASLARTPCKVGSKVRVQFPPFRRVRPPALPHPLHHRPRASGSDGEQPPMPSAACRFRGPSLLGRSTGARSFTVPPLEARIPAATMPATLVFVALDRISASP